MTRRPTTCAFVTPRRAPRGFSLIEMLIVIGILLVLLALLMPAIGMARAYARKVTARNEIENIAAAWQHYYSEYQRWPSMATVEAPLRISGALGNVLHAGAVGIDNPRRMKFMAFKRFNVAGDPVSPWGDPDLGSGAAPSPSNDYYYVIFDANFDNVIPSTVPGFPAATNIHQSAIVWTVNKDAKPGDTDYIIGDWQQ